MSISENILSIREQAALTKTVQERQNGRLFAQAAESIVLQAESFVDATPQQVGVELECLAVQVDGMLTPVQEEERNRILELVNTLATEGYQPVSAQGELGAGQIELNQIADGLFSADNLSVGEVVDLFRGMDLLLAEAAHANKASTLHLGFHPTADAVGVARTNKEKYTLVPNHHIQHRFAESFGLQELWGTAHEPDATAIGLSNALQFNLSMPNLETALLTMNQLFQISPAILALTGNASLIEASNSGWSDLRNHLWNQTHLTESGPRVFMPEGFIHTLEDLFMRMARFPLISTADDAQSALAISTGTNWLAAKPKFLCDQDLRLAKLLVEFRPMSLQQTPEQNAAALLLSLGRTRLAQLTCEPLVEDFGIVQQNALRAQQFGNQAELTVNSFDLATGSWVQQNLSGNALRESEITHAALGLALQGDGSIATSRFVEIRDFLQQHILVENPSRRLATELGCSWQDGNRQERSEHIVDTLRQLRIVR